MHNNHKEGWHRGAPFFSYMMDFLIIHMGLFHMLSFQLADNEREAANQKSELRQGIGSQGRRQSAERSGQKGEKKYAAGPLERLLRLAKGAQLYHRAYMRFYLAIEISRYALIGLLSLETFQDYQLLDCFILGRFRFVGRTNRISGVMVFLMMILFGLYRLVTFNLLITPFKFYGLEFLMYDHKQVVLEEIKFESRQSQNAPLAPIQSRSPGPTSAGSSHYNPVFHLKDPFSLANKETALKARTGHHIECIFRPNRTSRCWRVLDIYTRFLIYAALAMAFAWILLVYKLIGGTIFTDLGFELSYPSCTSWLQRRQSAANSTETPYKWIYEAPPVLASQMLIDDIPAVLPFSLTELPVRYVYQMARIFFDVLLNICYYTDFISFASCMFYLIVMSSLDVVLNASEIRHRLAAIVSKLAQMQHTRHLTGDLMSTLHEHHQDQINDQEAKNKPSARGQRVHSFRSTEQRRSEELNKEISTIQAIIADHFKLVRGYNLFISFALAAVLGTWCIYSLLIGVWIGSVRSTAVEFEFMVSEMIGTFYALVFLSGAAVARSLNQRLYSLIARAMALHHDNSATKMRWTSIMKLYSPRPSYCFTLLGFTEISTLFCLEFVTWMMSSYIVLAKFFYAKRDPINFS